jgi:predicted ATPase/DNA-binding CsgD family transcriptional regulator
LDALGDLLHLQDVRLITVMGAAGVGKTRLALGLAEHVADQFADGVVFVPLADISRDDLVVSAVASALGLRDAGTVDLSGITQFLERREALLVVDNFEHVMPAARVVPSLLSNCPGVKALVTSRGPLRVRGEHVFSLPPLDVPSADTPIDSARFNLVPSVALFIDRARSARPDYEPSADPQSVADLCRRLDGVPLAIELAAASVRLLTPAAILGRLEGGFGQLPAARRDVPKRHESVGQALDWSYDLLSADEKRLFRRLTVFTGGCSLEAAEAIAGSAAERFLEHLDGVVSQSLVRVSTDEGDVRLSMLQTVAEYGRKHLLESGEAADLEHRHARFFCELSEREQRAISTADRERALQRLERERSNLRAALDHLLVHGSPDEAGRMAAALAPFWRDHGYLDEGRRRLDDALRRAVNADVEIRMAVVVAAATIAYEDDRIEDATSLAKAAFVHYAQTNDVRGGIAVREILAAIARFRGDRLNAIAWYDDAIERAEGLGDRWLEAHLLDRKGVAAWAAGEYAIAERALDSAIPMFSTLGDEQGQAYALWTLGSVDSFVGRTQLGVRRMEQALPVLRRGRHRRELARALWNLGVAYLRTGQVVRAEEVLREATARFREVKFGRHMSAVLLAFAQLAAQRGHTRRAGQLLGATHREWEASRWTPPAPMMELWQDCEALVRRKLGASGFDEALATGHGMSLEEALHEALHADQSTAGALSARETEVLELVAEGLSNAEIGERLFVSVRTVHAHLRSAYTKLEVGSRTAALRRASELGIVSTTPSR